jgi:hypothetical protein
MSEHDVKLIKEIRQAVTEAETVKVTRDKFGYEIDHGSKLAKYKGTTGLLKGIPKPALVGWGINQVAGYALEHIDAWKDLPKRDALALLKGAPWRNRDSKGERGSHIHDAIEAVSKGEPIPENLTDDERCCVEGVQDLLTLRNSKTLASEVMGFNVDHGYAGTFDHWEVNRETGTTWLLDWKSSKFVYPENSVQMVAYQNFTHVLLGAKVERNKSDSYAMTATGKLVEWKPEYAQRLAVVHVEPHQSTLYPVQPEYHGYLLDVFIAAMFIKDHMDNVDTWKRKAKINVFEEPISYGGKLDDK